MEVGNIELRLGNVFELFGINGENVLPDLPEVRYDSQITFFCDGTMILVYTADGRRLLYTVAYDPAE